MNHALSESAKATILGMQCNEITEYHIYNKIALCTKDEHNKEVLLRIANEELNHYLLWQTYTDATPEPNKWKIFWYPLLARIFGFTFVLKLMESGENKANNVYQSLVAELPIAEQIAADEERHENELLEVLDEERLQYVGSMVLGLNDALVELTGTLAGLTFALQSNKLVALSGLITGIAATLSMASSEYLSTRSEGRTDAFKSCTYTGITYSLVVLMLVMPYVIMPDTAYLPALGTMLGTVVLIIFLFTYYISVAKGLDFKSRFLEMAGISLGVALISFALGLAVKHWLGIELD